MKNAYIAWFLVCMLSVISVAASAETIIDDSKNTVYLFTMASKSGTFEGDTLTLKDVPLVVYFADRPVREAGHLRLEKFVTQWDKGIDNFKNDPPNAELAIYNESGDKHAVLIINKPEVKADQISFKVKLIGPKSFGHSTLFIDAVPTMVNGQITD